MCQMFGLISVHGEFCSDSFTWCKVSSPNVWIDSVQDGVSDISDVLVGTQSINEDYVTWCRLF